MKGVIRFGKKEKLAPRYIGPFEILERIGMVAYRLALPPNMSQVHPVFHISMLRKYIFRSFACVAAPKCGIERRFDVRERTNCDCRLPSASVEIESYYYG